MSMSKKDFIALADSIKDHNRIASHPANKDSMQVFTTDQLETLASACGRSNPSFMRSRWFGYIAGKNGPNGGEVKTVKCPKCKETIWDVAKNSKLNKCWNCMLAFD